MEQIETIFTLLYAHRETHWNTQGDRLSAPEPDTTTTVVGRVVRTGGRDATDNHPRCAICSATRLPLVRVAETGDRYLICGFCAVALLTRRATDHEPLVLLVLDRPLVPAQQAQN